MYRNKMSQASTIIKGAMSGTDMDYDSAERVAEFVLRTMPYYEYRVFTLAELPERVAGFPTKWIFDHLIKVGVFSDKGV